MEFGGFAGLFDASALRHYRRPLLVTATDGVGTKVAVAQRDGCPRHDRHRSRRHGGRRPSGKRSRTAVHDRLHRDRAALCRSGSQRLSPGSRMAVGRQAARFSAARRPNTPGLLAPDEYDVAGAGTAVVEADQLLGPNRVRAGDVVFAMACLGAASQWLLIGSCRAARRADWALERPVPEFGRTLGEELLKPTRIYA